MALAALVTIVVSLFCAQLSAETQEDHSHFEVASIRPADQNAGYSYAGPATGDPGRIRWSRIPLKELILNAYPEYWEHGMHILGPAWIEDEYSVTATIPPGSNSKDVAQMLRNLVSDRFGLKFHEENKDVQGFELTIGQTGFKLTSSTADVESTPSNPGAPITPSRTKLDREEFPILTSTDKWRSSFDRESGVVRASFRQCSMGSLAGMLSATYAQMTVPVVDKTEIQGLFDFHLVLPAPSFTILPPRLAGQVPPQNLPDDLGIDLRGMSGTLEKQTGLRLKAVKITLRTMIIDHVARTPTDN